MFEGTCKHASASGSSRYFRYGYNMVSSSSSYSGWVYSSFRSFGGDGVRSFASFAGGVGVRSFTSSAGGVGVRSIASSAGGVGMRSSASLGVVSVRAWSCLAIAGLPIPRLRLPLVPALMSRLARRPLGRSECRDYFCNVTQPSLHYPSVILRLRVPPPRRCLR